MDKQKDKQNEVELSAPSEDTSSIGKKIPDAWYQSVKDTESTTTYAKSQNGLMNSKSKVKAMLYDDAIEMVGGNGRYQKLMFVLMAFLCNYAQQPPYTFGYTSNPVSMDCRMGEDSEWIKGCDVELICEN